MPEEIFRKKSLERLSSPEQLDTMLKTATPKGWAALIALGALIVLAVIWSIYGSLPSSVAGRGILMRAGGVYDVVSTSSGRIKNLYFNPDDEVQKGRIVARLEQPQILDDIRTARSELQDIRGKYNRTAKQAIDRVGPGKDLDAELWEIRQKIREKEIEIKGLYTDLEQNSRIRSLFTGRVLEVGVREGMIVEPGASIMKIELMGRDVKTLEALLYFPAGEGKKIRRGMKVHVSPSTVSREQYGFLLGMVTYVSDYPATQQAMMRNLKNEELVERLSMGAAPIEVYANLIPDPRTHSGYKWSSSSGPPVKIQTGTLCDSKVIVERRRPIDLVLPFLRSHIFGEAR